MSLDIVRREREGIAILDLKGRITMGDEVTGFREAVDGIAVDEQPRLILNMRDVEYVDSTGLGAMVMCSTRLKKSNGAAKLVHLNRRNMELIVMTKIDTIFEVFDDETDAVNSFFPGRDIKKFDLLSFLNQIRDEA